MRLLPLEKISNVDLTQKEAIASDRMQVRWLRVNIIADKPKPLKFIAIAKNDLNVIDGQRIKFKIDPTTELQTIGIGENKIYIDRLPIVDIRGDGRPTPLTKGIVRYIEATRTNLISVKFKTRGIGAPFVFFSLTDNYATAKLANIDYFIVGDIEKGISIPYYIWVNADGTAPIGKEISFIYDVGFILGE